ncbi:type II toxin-antitoxin system PemK/MazF family toxin [Chitinophaga sp. S165]|uniref:type II toxin-antitoxin system PemK/MazF family toxin n=1 Tax=Chitinophaga sp. S165 TaxID=2135462 RepID=UPI000D71B23C|nr:type II toxin-antitoxin system PemK/MazF family toxin [Chitinophaga sp. S165]PWV48386.1 PemK-like, MazF-like toxin of type II toxin-antitoxin system [Chitinophaga sp. S165]
MAVNQRDVYILPHPFGNNHGEPHPHIVLSVLEANEYENTFVAVMITSSAVTKDDLSFPINDRMFEKPLAKKDCHVRMHLVTMAFKEDIDRPKINTMKIAAFKELMEDIGDLIFDYDFQSK